MKRSVASFCLCLVSLVAIAPLAHAATSGTSNVILAAKANVKIQITDASITLDPTATDYANDFVEAAGASGLRVMVQTNSTTGVALLVRCDDAAPQIALADLLVKTATAPGGSGTSISSYTALTASDQTLWTTTTTQKPWLTVTSDIRVQNLGNYDAATGSGTDYTNTLTYSVLVQ